MKVLVIGLCPYLVTSRSKTMAVTMKYLYANGYQVAGAVWGHDETYFLPAEDGNLYYEFDGHKIPITSFSRDGKEAMVIYEIMKALKPDLVVTVGDYNDFSYMKAIKQLGENFKWLFLLMNYSAPIDEHSTELLDNVDGVLCSSEFGQKSIQDFCPTEICDFEYLGANRGNFYLRDEVDREDKFRIMASGKPSQVDNLPTIMEAVALVRSSFGEIDDIELYLHTSLYDPGDYNLEQISTRFDPKKEFIKFPEKYVSLRDEMDTDELAIEMNRSDVFVSIPLVSASSMSVFDALACGCYPIMSDCGSNRNVAKLLEEYSRDDQTEDFLVPSAKLMTIGGTYLYICSPQDLALKISNLYENWKINAGEKEKFSQFTLEHNRGHYLDKLSKMLTGVEKRSSKICLE